MFYRSDKNRWNAKSVDRSPCQPTLTISFYVQTQSVSALTLLPIFICCSICVVLFFSPSPAATTKWLLFSFLILTIKQTKRRRRKEPSSVSVWKSYECQWTCSTVPPLSARRWCLDAGVLNNTTFKELSEKYYSSNIIINAPDSHSTKCVRCDNFLYVCRRNILFENFHIVDTFSFFFFLPFFCSSWREAHRHHMFSFYFCLLRSHPAIKMC